MAASITCPTPDRLTDRVELAHGSGGSMTARLIDSLIRPAFGCELLDRGLDSAILPAPPGRLAFTTDTFVVNPLFFPGGCIGDLAVNGTANDLLTSGATPRYLSVGFVIEDGLPMDSLRRIVGAMAEAARRAEMEIVTGDTKVVERGRTDGIYINTSGIGFLPPSLDLDPVRIRPGDALLLTGPVASHGMAVMSVREGLQFDSSITSDTASLGDVVHALLGAAPGLRVLRDPTRGGLAGTLCEFAEASECDLTVDEDAIPVLPQVRSACELLGLDPLHVANEGVMLAVVPADEADAALAAVRRSARGHDAAIIGRAGDPDPSGGRVWLSMAYGIRRRLSRLPGSQLPRIC